MEKKIIIFPDIHGCDFWKETFKQYPNAKKIFLGDYNDSYNFQQPKKEVWDNFAEIVKEKKKDPDKVILLIGNHDRHYMKDRHRIYCRFSSETERFENEQGLYSDASLFKIAHEEEINGTKFLFTHAGINGEWSRMLFDKDNIGAADLEDLYEKDKDAFDSIYSYWRGGEYNFGSPIWADIREYIGNREASKYNGIQVVGHTQMVKEPFNVDNRICCIDCRRPFYIDEYGILREMDDKIVIKFDKNGK